MNNKFAFLGLSVLLMGVGVGTWMARHLVRPHAASCYHETALAQLDHKISNTLAALTSQVENLESSLDQICHSGTAMHGVSTSAASRAQAIESAVATELSGY